MASINMVDLYLFWFKIAKYAEINCVIQKVAIV